MIQHKRLLLLGNSVVLSSIYKKNQVTRDQLSTVKEFQCNNNNNNNYNTIFYQFFKRPSCTWKATMKFIRIELIFKLMYIHPIHFSRKKIKSLVDDTSNSFNAELVPIFCLTQLKASLNRATEIIVLTCQAFVSNSASCGENQRCKCSMINVENSPQVQTLFLVLMHTVDLLQLYTIQHQLQTLMSTNVDHWCSQHPRA